MIVEIDSTDSRKFIIKVVDVELRRCIHWRHPIAGESFSMDLLVVTSHFNSSIVVGCRENNDFCVLRIESLNKFLFIRDSHFPCPGSICFVDCSLFVAQFPDFFEVFRIDREHNHDAVAC
jgi:hypothetical protein